jgi:DHA1 family inner membrane transport protein
VALGPEDRRMNDDRRSRAAGAPPRGPIGILALGTFAIGADVFGIAGILPLIAGDLNTSIEAAAQVNAAYALAYALGAPLLAVLSAPWPKERVTVLAIAGFAAADLLCAASPDLGALMAARVLAGICAALYVPTALALAAARAPPGRRGAGLSGVTLGTTTALVVGVPLGSWVGQHFGWSCSFLLTGACATGAATALVLARIPASALPPAPALSARLRPATRPSVLLVLLSQLLWSSCNYSIYHYSSVLLGERLGLDKMPWLLFATGVGALLGSFSGGRLADRFGPAIPVLAIAAVNAVNIGLLALSGASVLGASIALFLFGVAGWAIVPAQQSRLLALAGDQGAGVIALLGSTVYVGSAAGAAVGGLVLAQAGPAALPVIAGAGVVLGLLVYALSLRISRG